MLRSELIDTLHEENPHLTRFDVERVVAVVLESITQTLEKGARVELRGFGAFSVRYRNQGLAVIQEPAERFSCQKNMFPFSEQVKTYVSA